MASPDGFQASVEMWTLTWAPRNWAVCNGAILSIQDHTALFSLLGTTFGGDGRNTFALPDMRDRVPIGALGNKYVGERAGTEYIQLNLAQMPQHTHLATGTVKPGAMTGKGSYVNDPTNNFAGNSPTDTPIYGATATTQMGESTVTVEVQPAGGSQPVHILPPYLALNFIIALIGIYPPRN